MDKVLSILDWLQKIPTGFLLALSIVLGLLIFMPQSIAEILAVNEFRTTYRIFLGPTLLLYVSFLLTRLIMAAWHLQQARKNVHHRIDQLRELTAEEKGYLSQFIFGGVNTIYVAFGDGVAGGLEAKAIIYGSSNTINVLEGVPYNL